MCFISYSTLIISLIIVYKKTSTFEQNDYYEKNKSTKKYIQIFN